MKDFCEEPVPRESLDSPTFVAENGDQYWGILTGQRLRVESQYNIIGLIFHRVYGPAVSCVDGSQLWFRNGLCHREGGGPSVITALGTQEWCIMDRRHREDGPAIIYADGRQIWYLYGQRHRVDGPAVVNGDEEWWFHGLRHRIGGPAVICADGGQEWWQYGQRHRIDGPAVVYAGGAPAEWWFYGTRIMDPTHRFYNRKVILPNGVHYWGYSANRDQEIYFDCYRKPIELTLHREDGPAIECPINGDQEWYFHGMRHREDGPAVVNGFEQKWYFYDELHRADGPALIDWFEQRWSFYGNIFRMDGGPSRIWKTGRQEWVSYLQHHRIGGPAIICPVDGEWWCLHNMCHRIDGPAVIRADGTQEWWINGNRLSGPILL